MGQDSPASEVEEDCCHPLFVPTIPEVGIVVVATGARQPLAQTGQSISVADDREIASVQGPDLTRTLARLPGVTLSRNGGVGSFTGLRIRGADAEQLLVLVDGVRVADPAAPGGGFDFGNLLAGNIDKLELLRGSNSVAWGSQAIGGVLAVTTAALDGVKASAEYGGNETLFATAAAGIVGQRTSASLSAGFHRSDGFSAAAAGVEPDGFRHWQLGGKARTRLGAVTLSAAARFAEGRLEIDGFPPPTYAFADTAEYQDTRQWSGRIGADYAGENLDLAAGFALADTRRELFDPAFGSASSYTTYGRSERADLSGEWWLPKDLRLTFGVDREWSRFSTSFDAEKRAVQTSGHALLGLHRDDFSLSGGVRYDHHDRFGDAWTLGANGSAGLFGDWRLRASYGEGFKTPTLFQLLSDYGNAGLIPERSRSFDVGIEQGDRNDAAHFALTLFRRDSRDLIDFVSCFASTSAICAERPFGTYDNVGRARAEGFEVEGDMRPADGLQFRAAYSYVKAVNRANGKDLARRPRHALSLSGDWNLDPGRVFATTLGADVRLVGDSFDNGANTVRLDGHAVVTLRASRPLLLLDVSAQRTLDLFARIENVGDGHTPSAAGYGVSGRAAYAGLRARF
ncbi:MAG: TonB-dependent receptor plug domain-containing protein [Novosphingobium sp.]